MRRWYCLPLVPLWGLVGQRGVSGDDRSADSSAFLSDDEALHGELASMLETEGHAAPLDAMQQHPLEVAAMGSSTGTIYLEKLARPPARFDLLTNSFVYKWQTKAALARKVSGPMREWAAELKYRTGVHMELEPTFPERISEDATAGDDSEGGVYENADDVDITVYLFGSERGIFNCHKLMEAAIQQDPVYVRLGVFRRVPSSKEVEWLMLRRINREMRPPDIPPISLKLPGKWTLLYERYKEAAVRTLWEETGITVDPNHVFPTAQLYQTSPKYYWRVPVRYFVAEVPHDVRVEGPQVVPTQYMRNWDGRLLRQSPDPIDRAWAQLADPITGCAWMKAPMIDELQKPLRGEMYMATRYTPPPYSNLQDVVGLGDGDQEARATETRAPHPPA
ncbi:mitochondrial edited mRNA stability factor 1 [Trypanosoma rangeli]|uniref:Mitochondrial edited mRNA stability factor 1 n=1 Tax=Trypanosoma rangeli TaxID=5698 RepID=A0A422N863_TRYRA|nr:mitochondrial edited mRNA stability factor 1 [Trypanosoma rangeli]RNF01669.1 mitochondrial edited mRNA stability factor 1 [Trypanosoma rangeli]|eukprot:RNF01669.1 mitochondrial edited mRNA stability factor 1 [Trypanosoma rangeli]